MNPLTRCIKLSGPTHLTYLAFLSSTSQDRWPTRMRSDSRESVSWRRRRRGPFGDRAHHPVAEAGGADAEGQVEPAAQVLEGDHARQLHQLGVVEVLAQRVEQLLGDLDGCAAHPHRIVEDQLVEIAEQLAVPVAREREQLLIAQSGPPPGNR